jgi:hypothetical protein
MVWFGLRKSGEMVFGRPGKRARNFLSLVCGRGKTLINRYGVSA